MPYHIEVQKGKYNEYVYLRRTYRADNKVRSSRIYLGPKDDALIILHAMQSEHLEAEVELSYSGEEILSKIADSLSLGLILTNYTGNEKISEIMKNLIILRTLYPESKRSLFIERLDRSILKYRVKLSYLEEIYVSMDKFLIH
jgi:hypothetical protein